jgi:glycerophosphoryl diester phosphodiesterase
MAPSGSRFLAPARPRVFAHRGLALDVTENTLLAFERALAAGATHLETDVQLSRDGQPVVSHDPVLRRPGGISVRIDEAPLARLQQIDLGQGQAMPSLAEALEAFPGALFNIDIKAPAAAEAVATTVRDAGAVDRVLLTSFSDRTRIRAVSLLPGVASSPGVARLRIAVPAVRAGWRQAVARALRGCVAVQVPERARGLRIVTPAFIDAMHRAGVEVHVWTVNEPADMARLLDWGVDGLVTDRCDLASAVIASRG